EDDASAKRREPDRATRQVGHHEVRRHAAGALPEAEERRKRRHAEHGDPDEYPQAATVRHPRCPTSIAPPTTISAALVSCAAESPQTTVGLTRTNSIAKRAAPDRTRYHQKIDPSGHPRSRWAQSQKKIAKYAADS